MALVIKDRVKVTTTTTGTGALSLGAAAQGFQGFSVIGDGNETFYAIEDGTNWESGQGTWTQSTNVLSRDTVFESSNSNNLVNWGAGTKNVFVTQPASQVVLDVQVDGGAAASVYLTSQVINGGTA